MLAGLGGFSITKRAREPGEGFAMLTSMRRVLRRDDGASAVEYSLIAVAIAAIIVTVVIALGKMTHSQFSTTCTNFATASGTVSSDPAGCPSN